MEKLPEPWLRGIHTEGLSPFLQPIVDAWKGAKEDIAHFLTDFPDSKLWDKPFGCASVGFHLEHMAGVIDRLLSYAEQKTLSEQQFAFLQGEGAPKPGVTVDALLQQLWLVMEKGEDRLIQLSSLDLSAPRKVGRSALPSTLIGLCMHSGEHTTRHTGQLIVTARVLIGQGE